MMQMSSAASISARVAAGYERTSNHAFRAAHSRWYFTRARSCARDTVVTWCGADECHSLLLEPLACARVYKH